MKVGETEKSLKSVSKMLEKRDIRKVPKNDPVGTPKMTPK